MLFFKNLLSKINIFIYYDLLSCNNYFSKKIIEGLFNLSNLINPINNFNSKKNYLRNKEKLFYSISVLPRSGTTLLNNFLNSCLEIHFGIGDGKLKFNKSLKKFEIKRDSFSFAYPITLKELKFTEYENLSINKFNSVKPYIISHWPLLKNSIINDRNIIKKIIIVRNPYDACISYLLYKLSFIKKKRLLSNVNKNYFFLKLNLIYCINEIKYFFSKLNNYKSDYKINIKVIKNNFEDNNFLFNVLKELDYNFSENTIHKAIKNCSSNQFKNFGRRKSNLHEINIIKKNFNNFIKIKLKKEILMFQNINE